jgi:hypothetical protein
MTQEEAKQAALAAGIREDQITPQILAFYGYTPPAPTAGVVTGAVIPPETVKADIAALEKEAKENQIPAQFMSKVTNVLGWVKTIAVLVVLMAVLVTPGCSNVQATNANAQAAVAVKALGEQHLAFEDSLISYYRTEETKRIDDLYAAGIKSATKVVDGRDVIETNIADALSKKRFELLADVEKRIADMRGQQAQICANYATFTAYNEGLKAYFTQKASTFDALKQSESTLMEFLKGFATKKTQ